MALIKCPECGKEISDKSYSCVHCGFPIRSRAPQSPNTHQAYSAPTQAKVKPQKRSSLGTIVSITICILLVLYLVGSCTPSVSDPANTKLKSDVRCYWCSRVIRAGGVNIHATSTNGGLSIKCDYCGHSNSIRDR